jgi:hypothetical protein
VYGWVGGKHVCVDLTRVPTRRTVDLRFYWGQTTLKAASSKVAKYRKSCSDNQDSFMSLAFDTFDFLIPKIMELLESLKDHA